MEALAWDAYEEDMRVRVQSLPNAVNFIELGRGQTPPWPGGVCADLLPITGPVSPPPCDFPPSPPSRSTRNTTTRGQGECITLSTPDNTYFLYPLEEGFSATKLQFATEALWHRATKKTANI